MKYYTNNQGNIKKTGSESKFSHLSVLTLSITAECLSSDSDNLLFKILHSKYSVYFPDLTECSSYNSRGRNLNEYINMI